MKLSRFWPLKHLLTLSNPIFPFEKIEFFLDLLLNNADDKIAYSLLLFPIIDLSAGTRMILTIIGGVHIEFVLQDVV